MWAVIDKSTQKLWGSSFSTWSCHQRLSWVHFATLKLWEAKIPWNIHSRKSNFFIVFTEQFRGTGIFAAFNNVQMREPDLTSCKFWQFEIIRNSNSGISLHPKSSPRKFHNPCEPQIPDNYFNIDWRTSWAFWLTFEPWITLHRKNKNDNDPCLDHSLTKPNKAKNSQKLTARNPASRFPRASPAAQYLQIQGQSHLFTPVTIIKNVKKNIIKKALSTF